MKATPYINAVVGAVIVLSSEITAQTGASTNDAPVRAAASDQRFGNLYQNRSNVAKVAVSSGRLATTNAAGNAAQREAASLVPGGQSNGQTAGRAAGHQEGRPREMDALGIMKRSLSLNDDQASKLEPVLKEQQDKLNALRRDTSLSRQERLAKLKEIQQASNSKIRAQLTPEQADRWDKRLQRWPDARLQGTNSAKPGSSFGRVPAGKQPQTGPPWQTGGQQPVSGQQGAEK